MIYISNKNDNKLFFLLIHRSNNTSHFSEVTKCHIVKEIIVTYIMIWLFKHNFMTLFRIYRHAICYQVQNVRKDISSYAKCHQTLHRRLSKKCVTLFLNGPIRRAIRKKFTNILPKFKFAKQMLEFVVNNKMIVTT